LEKYVSIQKKEKPLYSGYQKYSSMALKSWVVTVETLHMQHAGFQPYIRTYIILQQKT